MPFDVDPICVECQSNESELWRKSETDETFSCNACFLKRTKPADESVVKGEDETGAKDVQPPCTDSEIDNNTRELEPQCNSGNVGESNNSTTTVTSLRKSTRNKKLNPILNKNSNSKGKGRRSIFKRCVYKSPSPELSYVVSSFVYHKGTFLQVGDIVSMQDVDGGTYYAQIRGFLQDQYCEKSAAVTWLVPTQGSPQDRFDPGTFILGPEEDYPRKLDVMEFVCHAPSDYFAPKSPYPTQPVYKDHVTSCLS